MLSEAAAATKGGRDGEAWATSTAETSEADLRGAVMEPQAADTIGDDENRLDKNGEDIFDGGWEAMELIWLPWLRTAMLLCSFGYVVRAASGRETLVLHECRCIILS